jgi:hypothetical protein
MNKKPMLLSNDEDIVKGLFNLKGLKNEDVEEKLVDRTIKTSCHQPVKSIHPQILKNFTNEDGETHKLNKETGKITKLKNFKGAGFIELLEENKPFTVEDEEDNKYLHFKKIVMRFNNPDVSEKWNETQEKHLEFLNYLTGEKDITEYDLDNWEQSAEGLLCDVTLFKNKGE